MSSTPIAAPAGTAFLAVSEDDLRVFPSAADALEAARRLSDGSLRLAVHAGDAFRDGERHAGAAVSGCLRLREIARPGQVLVSAAAAAQAPGAELHDVGVHRLRDLSPPIRVFALGDDSAAPQSLDATPNNLPTWSTTFVGRGRELVELHARLASTRLLTVAGPGGSGKTRLAAQLAAEQAAGRRDGVWWVELADATGADQVAAAVARATGVLIDPAQGAQEALLAQLAGRSLLLVLDNCEHVLDAAAALADGLCRGCPEVTTVVTGREPLGLAGEAVWRLPPLPAAEARALFVERAARARPDLVLDAEADAAITAMCSRLDGSPLALELASAWLGALTPRQIEAGLDDRFTLLVRSPRDAVPRHSSLLASMVWSHDLLDDVDRAVLRRLAVFAGGFDLAAARAVCAGDGVEPAAVLGALGRLVDKSLVVAQDSGAEVRYRLPETIREYAAHRLRAAGERVAAADRHLDHMLERVRAAEPDLDADRDRWRVTLGREHDNLRAAIEHGLDADDPARGRELAAALPWLWHLHRQGREGLDVLRRAIDRAPGERSALQARLLTGVALVADTAEPLDVELDAAQRAAELAAEIGDERLRSLCVQLVAVGHLYTDLDACYATALQSEAIAERVGEHFVTGAGLVLRGIVLHLRDQHARASELLAEGVERLAARGDRGVTSTGLAFLSGSALATGDVDAARELGERSVAAAAPLADHLRIGMGRSALALALGAGGDVEAGLDALEPVVPLVGARFLPEAGRALGLLHLWAGEPERAIGRLEAEVASTDGGRPTYLAVRALPALAAAQRLAGDAGAAGASAARGVELARERDMPAVLADALDELAHARDEAGLRDEALAIRAEHGVHSALVPLARRGRGPRGRPDGGWDSLTPAELEVVRLAAGGFSNPEIGARLYMSRSTVKTHLSHVYAKLGVANRTELAARAAARPG